MARGRSMRQGPHGQRRRTLVEIWFAIAALMLTAYVVLDGFDFGAGALHLFVARTDAERRQVLGASVRSGMATKCGSWRRVERLFVAFPPVLASGLSGFYFAIFLVLWSLILRGIAIEFRSHIEHPLWRAAWDFVFCAASAVLPVLFGAALGNLLRGLPMDRRLVFAAALHGFHHETAGRHPRLVHGRRRHLRAAGTSQDTAPRFWRGGRKAPCRRAVAAPPPFFTVLSRSCGQWRRCRPGSSTRIFS